MDKVVDKFERDIDQAERRRTPKDLLEMTGQEMLEAAAAGVRREALERARKYVEKVATLSYFLCKATHVNTDDDEQWEEFFEGTPWDGITPPEKMPAEFLWAVASGMFRLAGKAWKELSLVDDGSL